METILQHKNLIEIIAGIGTFLASIVALYSIFELRMQRRSMYKPELYLDSFTFDIIDNPLLKNHNLNKFRGKYKGKKNKALAENIYVSYRLENLGFGVAKSVECKWEFNYKSALKTISTVLPPQYELGKLIHYQTIVDNEDFQKTFNPNELNIQKIDFVLPISQGGKKRGLSVPNIIVDSYLYYLLFKYDLTKEICKTFNIEEFGNMPKLKLKLKYTDLSNKVYKKTLNIDVSCVSLQINDDDSLNTMTDFAMFYFTVSE